MKLTKLLYLLLGTAAVTLCLAACNNDDDDWSIYYPNALVTVRPTANNSVFLQLDDNTTLRPVNVEGQPFGDKEVRALINYSPSNEPALPYDRAVIVNWMDSILTKDAIPMSQMDPEYDYGNDPVEIVRDWVTIAEDGYLTLRFRTVWGNIGNPHYVNLITGVNPDNPYEVQFVHNGNGDSYGFVRDGIVAFRLDGLPDTEGKTVKLTLRWYSFSGEKSAQFNYRTRATTEQGQAISDIRPEIILR